MVHYQYFLLLLEPEAAVRAIPALIPDAESRRAAVAALRQVLGAIGAIGADAAERLEQVASMLDLKATRPKASVAA
jgi:hypothetical protein